MDADVTRPNVRRRWTDEDAAYAAAQWASGITQTEIARAFGYRNSAPICSRIAEFIAKYADEPHGVAPPPRGRGRTWVQHPKFQGNGRIPLVKAAIARFVEQRRV
jgi:hypothetical protein